MSSRKLQSDQQANEIRVSVNGSLSRYVKYALNLLRNNERSIIIKGAGFISGCTEILKRRVGGLHQVNSISSTLISSTDNDGRQRRVSVFEAELSLDKPSQENAGYQEPVQREEQQRYNRPWQGFRNQRHHNYNNNYYWNRGNSQAAYCIGGHMMRDNGYQGRGFNGQWFNARQRFYQPNTWRGNYQYQNRFRNQRNRSASYYRNQYHSSGRKFNDWKSQNSYQQSRRGWNSNKNSAEKKLFLSPEPKSNHSQSSFQQY